MQQGTTPNNRCVSAVPSVTSFPSLSNVMRPSAAKSVKEATEEEADCELERHVLDSSLVSLCRSDECCPWAQQVVHARYWSICLPSLGTNLEKRNLEQKIIRNNYQPSCVLGLAKIFGEKSAKTRWKLGENVTAHQF